VRQNPPLECWWQVARGVKKSAVKSTESANATRWTGIFRCARKSRLLEADIKIALTGEADGMCVEEPAQIEEPGNDSDNSDNSEGEVEVVAPGSDVESDAEQVYCPPPPMARRGAACSECV
jgi:hypothetical protein